MPEIEEMAPVSHCATADVIRYATIALGVLGAIYASYVKSDSNSGGIFIAMVITVVFEHTWEKSCGLLPKTIQAFNTAIGQYKSFLSHYMQRAETTLAQEAAKTAELSAKQQVQVAEFETDEKKDEAVTGAVGTEISSLREENETLQKTVASLESKNSEQKKNIDGLAAQVKIITEQSQKVSAELDEAKKETAAIQKANADLEKSFREEKDQLQKTSVQLQTEIKNLGAQLQEANQQNHQLEEEIVQLQTIVGEFREANASMETKTKSLADILSQEETARKNLADLKTKLEQQQGVLETLHKNIQSAEQKLHETIEQARKQAEQTSSVEQAFIHGMDAFTEAAKKKE